MATSFSVIYDRAVFRFQDSDWLKLFDSDKEEILRRYLYGAQAEFQPICLIDLSDRDDETQQYNQTLDEECIEILSLGVAVYWLSSKVMNLDLLRNAMSTKDYSFFSPANLLKEAHALLKSFKSEYRNRVIEYSYNHGDIAGLKQ